MGKILVTILKVLLALVILAVLAAGAYFLCGYLGWDPRWGVPIVVLSVVAAVAAVIFIRKLLFRRREEGFVKQVIEQDESARAGGPMFERRQLQDIENRFEEAAKILRRSHLRKKGDPLYVLPWYLMIGEPGSGKTTALRNSRLPSSFPELGHPSGDETTVNCDWWFFNDGVFIDTTGRYTAYSDQTRDREEWKKFLSMLGKYRRKEPINGLIVTVAADRLGAGDADLMNQYGRNVHLRIDQLMRVLGAKFPVYIMVTKADQVLGMNAFTNLLTWRSFKQAMGHLNRKVKQDSIAFLDEAMDQVTERLKDLRLMILAQNPGIDPGLLIFPEEMGTLGPGLAAFIRGAFQDNPYQEPPILRGIFFSSARQSGEALSRVLLAEQAGIPVKSALPGTNRGIFLQDFFGKILPDDRYLPTPIKEFVRWRRSTRDLGLVAVAAIAIVFCGLLGGSFLKNLNAIESFQSKFVKLPAAEDDLTKDIILMNSFSREIVSLERLNANWYLPRMGLHQSKDEETHLKDYYIRFFKKQLQDRIDKEIQARVASFDGTTPDVAIGQYAEHLVKRINIIKAFLAGEGLETQARMPQPSTAVLLLVDKALLPTIAADYNMLYLYSENWKLDKNEVERELDGLEAMLVRLIELKAQNMEWIVEWDNRQQDLAPITLSMFWEDKVDDSSSTGIMVRPAFTVPGKERIDDFMRQMKDALNNQAILEEREPAFNHWYAREYIGAWFDFSRYFLKEEQTRRDQEKQIYRARSKWQDLAVRMTTFNNPYFNYLDRMADEVKHLRGSPDAPPWLDLVVEFQAMKSQVVSEGFVEQAISLAQTKSQAVGEKVVGQGVTLFQKVTKGAGTALGQEVKPQKAAENRLKAVEQLKNYQSALQNAGPVLRSSDHAYQMAAQLLQGSADISASGSPFDAGYAAVEKMQALIGKSRKDEAVLWDLVKAPLDSLLYFTTRESACSLQDAWEEQVLADVQGVPDSRLQDELFGEQGVVWKFLDGPLAPFVRRNEKSYYAQKAYGQGLPLLDSFFEFLRQGAIGRHSFKDVYEVGLKGVPIEVNEGANDKPQAVVIELLCSSGVQRFENYNYPVNVTFKWTPEQCGNVTLNIVFRDFTMSKTYSSYLGFPQMLKDFRDGTRTFTAQDFPAHTVRLEKAGILRIDVRMELAGHEPVIELIDRTPLTAPRKIVYCWK